MFIGVNDHDKIAEGSEQLSDVVYVRYTNVD